MSMVLEAVFLLAQAVGLAAALALAWATVYVWNAHRKYAHIPGPARTSFFLGNQPEMGKRFRAGSSLSVTLYDWCLEYGHTYHMFLLHNVLVFTVDPEGVKSSLVTENFPKSSLLYQPISALYGTRFLGTGLVSEVNHDMWAARRNIINPAFSRGLLKPMMNDFNQVTDEFCKKLAALADGKTMITLLPELNKTTLDVIGKVAYGLDLNSLHDSTSSYNNAITKTMEGFREYTRYPIERRNPFSRRSFKQEVRDAVAFLRTFAHEQLENRKLALKRGDYVPEDILSFIIKAQEELGGDSEAIENAVDQFNTFFIAGQETTANTLAFALMELGRHPEIYQKLREEVDEVLGSRSDIDFNDLPKLVYCDHVMRETLRMHPPVAVTFRQVEREGYSIGPYSIPKGADIIFSTFVSARHPDFTEDPVTFKPERFADDKTKPSRYMTFPFALGPRNCIGQNFAKMEAKVVLAKFVQRFDMKLDPSQSFDFEEVTTLKPKDGTRATLTIRD